MSTANRSSAIHIAPIKTDGTPAAAGNGFGRYTLQSGTSYYCELGGGNAPLEAAQVEWDSGLIVTISLEDSNLGVKYSAGYSTAAGEWIKEDPASAVVSTTSTDGTTGGASVSGATVTVPGGTAGGAMYHVGNTGAMRTRIKLAVGGTGGQVRVSFHSKAAA